MSAAKKKQGVVLLTDWWRHPTQANTVIAVAGDIEVVSTESAGIKVGSSSEKWLAVVSGKTQTLHIPGCKVNGILYDEKVREFSSDTWWLL